MAGSNRTEAARAESEPRYSGSVFEGICEAVAGQLGEAYWKPLLRIDDRGVWVDPSVDSDDLRWRPLIEIDQPGSPDPRDEPSFPFPFTAPQLAAFLVDGVGALVRADLGEWETGPDLQSLKLGVEDTKVKEALRSAYQALREADKAMRMHHKGPVAEYRRSKETADHLRAARERAQEEFQAKAQRYHSKGKRATKADAEDVAAVRSKVKKLADACRQAEEEELAGRSAWRTAIVRYLLRAGDRAVPESPEQRQQRLRARVAEEKAKGNGAFLKTIAEEEGISVARLKQILAKR
ncbi:MAG: hypothetical protein BroJett031_35680 [Betaproteobacteria bacterium]|nr:MAG: hypothetical protein BroJett031_35680 [Betaproteobacteria bacterium]